MHLFSHLGSSLCGRGDGNIINQAIQLCRLAFDLISEVECVEALLRRCCKLQSFLGHFSFLIDLKRLYTM